ncbi:MAG: tetratricopeptide repeat protein, partial [Endomicrobiaceae bacterium]|nr:tetratricopeptide repeat protein [Endomicrobiaceae bacterium]
DSLYVLKDYRGALRVYHQIIKKDPVNFDVTLKIAFIYEILGEEKKYFEYITEAAELKPGSKQANLSKAGYLIKQSKYEEAHDLIKNLMMLNPDDDVKFVFASILFNMGEYAKCIEVMLQISSNDKKQEKLFYYYLGVSYFEVQNYEKANLNLEKAAEADPENKKTYYYMAQSLFDYARYYEDDNKDYYLKALENLKKAQDVSNDYKYVWLRAKIYAKLNDYQNASLDFETAVKMNPSDQNLLSDKLKFVKEDVKVPEIPEKSVKVENDRDILAEQKTVAKPEQKKIDLLGSNVLLNRGNINFKNNKYQEALEDFSKAIDLNSSNSQIYLARAGVYLVLKDIALALEDLNKALELSPDSNIINCKIADVYSIQNNYEKAEHYYKKSIELKPKSALAYLGYAQLCEKHNRKEKAIENYSAAAKLDIKVAKECNSKIAQLKT